MDQTKFRSFYNQKEKCHHGRNPYDAELFTTLPMLETGKSTAIRVAFLRIMEEAQQFTATLETLGSQCYHNQGLK